VQEWLAVNGPGDTTTNGGVDLGGDDREARILDAIASAYAFPGYYPVVVIARTGLEFEATLMASIAAQQGDAPYRVTERASRRGNYRSYRVELYVDDPVAAVAGKAWLSQLEGVLFVI
jgi:putative lipoic acid-binding regulatory protein